MSSTQGLLIAVDMALGVRDAARQSLREAQAACDAAHHQLAQLEVYARDTDQRWGMQSQSCVLPEVMRHHYSFMARLVHAIDLQTSVVREQGTRFEACQQALLQAELRLTSLKKVTEKREADHRLLLQRRDQKQLDELASLKYLQATRPFDQG